MKYLRKLTLLCVCLSQSLFSTPTIETMTLEEKIGQLLMVHFQGEIVNDDAKQLRLNSLGPL